MAMSRQELTDRILNEYAGRGMLANVVENSARRSVVILAQPDIGEHKIPLSFHRPDWTVGPTPWFNSWWAKLLRRVDHRLRLLGHRFPCLDGWLSRYLAFGLRLPYWLDALVHSESIRVGYKRESLPVDVLERIMAMANYLRHVEKVQPSKVLLGRKAMHDLKGTYCADYLPDVVADSGLPYGIQILGMKAQISPFLAEDEVLVV